MARGFATSTLRHPAIAAATALTAVVLSACGSAAVAELPAPAKPDRSPALRAEPAGTVAAAAPGGRIAADLREDTTTATLRDGSLRVSVDPRARTLTLTDAGSGARLATATAGVGPTHVRCSPDGPCFVVDTQGDALLVFRVGADDRSLRLTRRVFVDGAPYGFAIDRTRGRLWVGLTARNELVELGAHGRPHILQRLPTIRQPGAVAVDEATGDVFVQGAGDDVQRLTDPASPDR